MRKFFWLWNVRASLRKHLKRPVKEDLRRGFLEPPDQLLAFTTTQIQAAMQLKKLIKSHYKSRIKAIFSWFSHQP